jgi:hypothetical protein
MESQLAVDEKNNLVEVQASKAKYPAMVRIVAKIISYIFHPLFIPVYLSWLLVKTQSYLFGAFTEWEKTIFIARFGVIYIMFPLVSVLLMKALGFISSIHLKNQRDRIIPYVVCMIYYWWMWYVLHNQPEYPKLYVVLSLAVFLASIGGLMANINMKVSMHAIAAGVMAAFVMLLGFSQDIDFGIYIAISILVTGIICTSRLIDSDHTTKEIYWGLFIGIVSILVSEQFA